MKKILLIAAIIMMWTSTSWAAWTLDQSIVYKQGNYVVLTLLFTSDGSATTAQNIKTGMTLAESDAFDRATWMTMDIDPGTEGVAPGATIDISFLDATGKTHFAHTAYAYDADTIGVDLSEDEGRYLCAYDMTNITFNDIGDSGDQITLQLTGYIESGTVQ